MPHADINGARLYFEDTGGAKPAVLFTHEPAPVWRTS